MQILLNQGLSREDLKAIEKFKNLADVLRWAFRQPEDLRVRGVIADFVVHDEFTHDVLLPWKAHWMVFQAT